jgi:tetratricopeptide (TPR) repeat protein
LFTGGNKVPEEGRVPEQVYRAFISYSHRDDAIARTLHKRLETYRLPKHLIGSETPRGPLPKQLTPIFRDLDELSAADDLSAEIKAALARSEVLIILASPAAKASKWVNLEIENFRALHGAKRPVLVALIEGEPADAFPPALTAGGHEPVAADFRKSAPGGKRLALLKLVAGITAAPLDALVQRDAQRQYRRVMAITGSALTAVLVMALLLVVALRSQAEAQRQRQEAEGLVEYMLTDLRDKLKGVGRLDVMTAVNERAMRYYGGQERLEDMPPESLQRRARILHAMGEDDEKRGNLNLALDKFEEAHRTTAALLVQKPDDPNRIFNHAQSEYWLGQFIYSNKFSENPKITSTIYFKNYKNLGNMLIKIDSTNPKWLREAGYASGNLCSTALMKPIEFYKALYQCESALNYMLTVYKLNPRDTQSLVDVANRYAWLADVWKANNNWDKALEYRKYQIQISEQLMEVDPKNIDWQELLMLSYLSISELNFEAGYKKYAKYYLEKAEDKLYNIQSVESNNQTYYKWKSRIIDLKKRIS